MITVEPEKILNLDLAVPPGSTPGEELAYNGAFWRMLQPGAGGTKAFSARFGFPFNVKAVLTEAGQALVGAPESPGLFGLPSQAPYVFQLVKQVPILASYINKWEEGGSYVDVADVTAENDPAPEFGTWTISASTLPVRKIFSLARASDELLEDFPLLAEFLNARLIQGTLQRLDSEIINGSGSGSHLLGVLSSSPTVLAKGGLSRSDALLTALSRIRSIGFGRANGIVMNPADALLLATDKASTSGDYSAGAPGQFTDSSKPIYEFGGAPVLQTNAIATGNVLVGDWSGAILFMRRDVIIENSDTDADNWQKNVVTLRCSLRAAFLCHTPTKFVSITGF